MDKLVALLWMLGAGAAIVAWVWLCRRRTHGQPAWIRRGLLAARIAVAFTFWLLAIHGLASVLALTTTWPIWFSALLGAAASEGILALYLAEAQSVGPRARRWLLGLRLALVALVLCMLLQPALTFTSQARHGRVVAVLVDDSASMQSSDVQASATEKLQLARLFGLSSPDQPGRLDQALAHLRQLQQDFTVELNGLNATSATNPQVVAAQLAARRDSLTSLLDKARQTGAAQRQVLSQAIESGVKLTPEAQQAVEGVQAKLDQLLGDQLTQIEKALEATDAAQAAAQWDSLRAAVQAADRQLAEICQQLEPLPAALDEALLASLPAAEAGGIDQLAQHPRRDIAREVLLSTRADSNSLLETIRQKYGLKLYQFASRPRAAEPDAWQSSASEAAPQAGAEDEDSAAEQPATDTWRHATSFSAALAQVREDVPADQLAGVLLLSDGRHNAGAGVEALARQLSLGQASISSVLIGSTVAPPDAAIVDVDGPETVFLGDKVVMNAAIKVDGFQGNQVVVKLLYNGQAVDQETVPVADGSYRISVPLDHVPAGKGIHQYRVEVTPAAGETVTVNNSLDRQVAVTDDRIKLLIVERRPRWEFRYLKNLFAGRDKTVYLQYVLLQPDNVAGAPQRLVVPASVSRPYGEFEATALPATEEEWLKFDCIVLGDVPPEMLGDATAATLQKFVGDLGGTLIVIAGPNHMPHGFAGSQLLDLLPVTVQPGNNVLLHGPEPAYRLALTPEGRTHVIMKQRTSTGDSAAVWDSLPALDWRHAVQETKPGATVLAYAVPTTSPGSGPAAGNAAGDRLESVDPAEILRQQKQHALIALQKYGAGNVLMLTFDRTWRLRYRIGDTYHHRFWGQVLRWATTDKLSAGTAHVRLGTDRMRYQADERVVVRAQLLDAQANPVESDAIMAEVYQGDELLLSKQLDFVPNSRGMYEGDLAALGDTGAYRIELKGPPVAELLALDQAETVQTEFAVAEGAQTSEFVELSADPAICNRLATLSGGKVFPPDNARGVLELLGEGSKSIEEQKYVSLWDSWALLTLMLLAVSGEWILRKKVGLP